MLKSVMTVAFWLEEGLWLFSAASRISEMANTPTSTVRMSKPPFRALEPKV